MNLLDVLTLYVPIDSTFCFFLYNTLGMDNYILLDFSCSVKAAPHECVIRTGQP